MKLKIFLIISLICYITYITIFALPGVAGNVTVFSDGWSTLSLNAYVEYGVFIVLSNLFFILFLCYAISSMKGKAFSIIVIVLASLVWTVGLLDYLLMLIVDIQYDGHGQYIMDEYIFQDTLCSLLSNNTRFVVLGVVYSCIEPVVYLLLIVVYACMRNLVPMTRVVCIITCAVVVVNQVLITIFGRIDGMGYVVQLLYATMLALLCMNSGLLEKKYLNKL